MIYSKVFNSFHLSLVVKSKANLFRMGTVFTFFLLFLTQIPVLVASFYLVYNKMLKDQLFYSCCECLAVTVISIVISMIDIHKGEDYFEETDFIQTHHFLEKANNHSLNQLEEVHNFQQDEGSVEGEKYVGLSGGKLKFTKQDPNSFN